MTECSKMKEITLKPVMPLLLGGGRCFYAALLVYIFFLSLWATEISPREDRTPKTGKGDWFRY